METGAGAHNFHFLIQGFSWTSGEQHLRAAQEFKSHLAKVGDRWPRLTRPPDCWWRQIRAAPLGDSLLGPPQTWGQEKPESPPVPRRRSLLGDPQPCLSRLPSCTACWLGKQTWGTHRGWGGRAGLSNFPRQSGPSSSMDAWRGRCLTHFERSAELESRQRR